MKFIPLFILSITLVGCSSKYVRLNNPETEKEKAEYGIVGFGLFVIQTTQDSNSKINDDDGFISSIDYNSTQFQRITSVDTKNNLLQTSLFLKDEPLPVEEIDGVKYFRSNITEDINQDNTYKYFGLNLKSTNEYILDKLRSSYPCGNGNYCTFSLRIPEKNSYDTMKIKGKPGEITFLGNYIVNIITDKAGFLGIGRELSVRLEPVNNFLLNTKSNTMIENFFGSEERTEIGMEINFLKKFSNLQGSGYWKEKAETRIRLLSSRK
ncbi:MAG: hypothetical protein GPI99_15395 [Microcystis aeruginosa W13-15]|nr:hypothetical protein [Microcystis aeruginosa W13-15]